MVKLIDVEMLVREDPYDLMFFIFDVDGPRHQYRNWTAEQMAARINNMTEQRKRRLSHTTGAE